MKIIFTIWFSLMGALAFAQMDTTSFEYDSTIMLDELVVSASRFPEMKSQLTQQIHLVNQEQIKILSAQTTADLISNSGMVAVQKSQQGGGSPQLRGFEASRVLLVIDGVRMNNMIYRAGHLQNMITLDNNTLERAEILLGPSSTVYGSDALGGVIHFRTKSVRLSTMRGELKISGNALYRYSSANNENTFHADVNLGGAKFGSFTSITKSEFGDLRMGEKNNNALGEPFGLRPEYVVRSSDNATDVVVKNNDPYVQKFSGYSQLDVLQKFLYKPNTTMSHELNLQYSNSGNIPRYDRLTDVNGGAFKSAEWYYGPQKRLMAAYTFGLSLSTQFADEMKATLSYQNIEESRHDRGFDKAQRRNQIEKVDVLGATLDFQKSFGANIIRYGYDGQFNKLNSTAYRYNIADGSRTAAATRYPDGDNTMNFSAVYVSHTLNLNDELTITDGARVGISKLHSTFIDKTTFNYPFDEVNQKNSYASGNLGVLYKPLSQLHVSLMGSTGFRVPNVDDLAKVFESVKPSNTEPGKLVLPNPEVRPEKTFNVDLGVTNQISEKLFLENRVFYTWFRDAIVMDAFTYNGESTTIYEGGEYEVFANQNKRRAWVKGFSSALKAHVGKFVTLSGAYNYTKGRIDNGGSEAPLDHIPPAFGRISAAMKKDIHSFEVFSNFNGWKRIDDYFLNGEDNEQYAPAKGMPSWYTINFRYDVLIAKRFDLLIGIDNIMDLQYRTFASGINAPGRNFIFRLLIPIEKK
jgi:hemoglobin/transferrin/lactoferrin receptor protein